MSTINSGINFNDQLGGLIKEGKIDFKRTNLKGEVSVELLLLSLLADPNSNRLEKNISALRNILDIDAYMNDFSLLTQARILTALGDFAQAEAMYLNMIENKEQGSIQAHFILIDMYLENNDYNSAVKLYREACILGESINDQELHTSIRVYSEKIGRFKKPRNRKDFGSAPSATAKIK